MSPLRGPTAEHRRYLEAAAVVNRARRNAGVELPPYTRREWDADRRALRESIDHKRRLRREEAARIEAFEGREYRLKRDESEDLVRPSI